MADRPSKPWLAVTIGDVAGIGPEVIARAWTDPIVHQCCRAVVVGHPEILRRALTLVHTTDCRPPPVEVAAVRSPCEVASSVHLMPCLTTGTDDVLDVAPAAVDAIAGQAAYEAVIVAADLARTRQVDAITTAPISKQALWRAGHHYPGHTELLAERCGVGDFAMMLYLPTDQQGEPSGGLGVVHVSLHTALRAVFDVLTPDTILRGCRLAHRAMARLTRRAPRIGVCALNPHAGEGGLFGDEELSAIRPAVERGRREGMDLTGPLPADTLFVAARDGCFDAIVAMYHDQGHIALKLMGMHRAVNVTLGLPIVRTSVAHGTAGDLAWQGRANPSGMVAALQLAARLATPHSRLVDH